MRHVVVSGIDKDDELQIIIKFEAPKNLSWQMCRRIGLARVIRDAVEFSNVHRGTGPVEQWVFAVREEKGEIPPVRRVRR